MYVLGVARIMIKCLEPIPYIIPCSLCKHREYCEDEPIDIETARRIMIDYINGQSENEKKNP